MYACRVDHIQRLMAQWASETDKAKLKRAGVVSAITVEQRIRKWLFLGLVEREKLLLQQPAWVWLSREGLRVLEASYHYLKPKISNYDHYYLTHEVRCYIEARQAAKGIAMTWRSERRIRHDNGQDEATKHKHAPDGEVITDKNTIAVEIELTQKSKQRIQQILRELAHQYRTIWYFTNEITHGFLERQIKELPEESQRPKFKIYSLSDIETV